MEREKVNLKKAIKVSLANNNMSAKEFCVEISVTESYFSQVLNGKINPSIVMLERLANGFDMKVSEFVALGE